MRVITGDKYIISGKLVVSCDPECLDGIIIKAGDKVVYEGNEYTAVGSLPPTPKINRWGICLEET